MPDETVVILGVPVDNVTMDETVRRIMAMINAYAHDRRPRLVATVNVDFLVNTLNWFSSRPRHPELLKILRQASLVTADGMPIVWAGRLMGTPLKGRVTGADLVPMLAREAAQRQKSIYFLGGRDDVGRRAADILKHRFAGLTIAGADAPFVAIEGEALADAKGRDAQIVDKINRSGAHILLVAFGNPKQEIWFERNRSSLQVPVTIGIGGTFEFITGSVARAPRWMQRAGIEWIFRISQDPKRLWKRYVVGLFKFSLMILPPLIYYVYRRLVFKGLHPRRTARSTLPERRSAGALPIQLIHMADPLDAGAVRNLSAELTVNPLLNERTVLDFSRVTFIDSTGIGFLLKLRNQAREEGAVIYLTGIRPAVERTLKLSRIHDLFAEHICGTTEEVLAQIQGNRSQPEFHYLFTQKPDYLLLRLYGTLDAAQAPFLEMDAIMGALESRHCVIDLEGVSFVDSSGLMVLLKIHRHTARNGRTCRLSGAAGNVRQMLRITRLDRLIPMATDVDAAVASL